MTDFFRQMMEKSQEMARAFNPAMESFFPASLADAVPTMPRDAMEAIFGNTFNTGGLDAKTRLLLTLGALTVQGAQAEPQITLTVRHLHELGATDQEVAETIAQMSVFAGVPAMTKAMQLAQAELARLNAEEGE